MDIPTKLFSKTKIFSTIIVLLISIVVIICISQKKYAQRINNNMNIVQVSLPESDTLYSLYGERSPIVFQNEIDDWDGINILLGRNNNEINQIVSENKKDVLTIITGYLQFHQPLFTYDWFIDFQKIIYTFNSPIFIIQQKNYHHLIANMNGEIRIILIPPNEHSKLGEFTNNVSKHDITSLLNQEKPNFEFIEIIVREGNMVYIPYLWHYFIYRAEFENDDSDTTIMNAINKSYLDIL
jgi:hypothetical protein